MAQKGKRKEIGLIITFSDEKLTPEQDRALIAEYVHTLCEWHYKAEKEKSANRQAQFA